MEIKQPNATTFPGFRHIHRTLLPGEALPARPTLLEQLEALRGATGSAANITEEELSENLSEVEEEQDEEWSEIS